MHLFPELGSFLAFLGACWVLQTSPGPDMMVVINNSVSRGIPEGLLTVLGIFMGIAVQGPLLALGTLSLIAAYDGAFDLLRGAGATYLGYLAYRNFRTALSSRRADAAPVAQTRSNPVFEGFVTNLSNPKVLLFLFAFIPQFTVPDKGQLGIQLLLLLTILKLNGLLVNGSVAVIAGSVGSKIVLKNSKLHWGALLSGIVFLLIAVVFWVQILSNRFN